MQSLRVALGDRAYPIHVGPGLLDAPDLFAPHLGTTAAVVTNERVAPIYLERLARTLARAGARVVPVVVPDGEQHKDWRTLDLVLDALLAARCDRGVTVVALGGGWSATSRDSPRRSISAASLSCRSRPRCLRRSTRRSGARPRSTTSAARTWLALSTSRVPSSPTSDTLSTLPERELRAGLAEVIKHGLILDEAFVASLEQNMGMLLARDAPALSRAVLRSCELKAQVVAADEREQGLRAILNFGHTFAHAIEAGLGYGSWVHGEAVAAGMAMAAELSLRAGLIGADDARRARALVAAAGLPVAGPAELSADRYLELMSVDKKAAGGRIRFILLEAIGRALMRDDIPAELVRTVIDGCSGRGTAAFHAA